MRALVVAPQPFFSPRGTPFSIYYRALVMAGQGVECDILTYGSGQDVDLPGVHIKRIPRVRFLEPIPVGPSWRKLYLDSFMVIWTIGLLLRHRYRIVFAHEEAAFWCRFLKPLFGYKLVYEMHSNLSQQLTNFRFTRSRSLIGIFRKLQDSALKAADAVVTVCPDLRNYASEIGVPAERHVMIENSIFDDVRLTNSADSGDLPDDGRTVDFGPGHPVIGYAGTFEVYQGLEMLMHAFAQVNKEVPAARLLLVGGTASQVAKLAQLADSLRLSGACHFTGTVSKQAASRLMKSVQVLVSPRVYGTNTPLKIYENLSAGLPIVATRIWSHTQVLSESVCFLVEPAAASLAGGLLEALTDQARARERAANARALYESEYARPVYERKVRRLLELVG
jgi:glycosyltransferase involved in cell wall biosynthesis